LELSAVLSQLDNAGKFHEHRCESMPSVDSNAEFVLAATEVLGKSAWP
jgi:hypothetical protein